MLHAQGVEGGWGPIKHKTSLTNTQLGLSPIGISIAGVETSLTVSSTLYNMMPDQPFLASAHKPVPGDNKRGFINCYASKLGLNWSQGVASIRATSFLFISN